MNERFESSWRSVGGVSHVTIDFPDGTSMERTLGGNLCTWVTDSAGRVVDVIPGLMDAATYRQRLEFALDLALSVGDQQGEEQERALRACWSTESRGWDAFAVGLGGSASGGFTMSSESDVLDSATPFPSVRPVAYIDDFDVSIAKSESVEVPIIRVVGATKPDHFDGPLEKDTWLAVNELRPQALGLLCRASKPTVDRVSNAVFRRVLRVDPGASHSDLKPVLLGRDDGFVPGQ